MDDEYEISAPKPQALLESLRSIGYSMPTAVADIIDNSIAAHARNIWIDFNWAGPESTVSIVDDGNGMSETTLANALRPGSANPLEHRKPEDLGRFGLGLKTASFSQCRKVTVWSKLENTGPSGRRWDLDYVAKYDEWRLQKISASYGIEPLQHLGRLSSGTVVLWERLDRAVDKSPVGSDEAHSRFLRMIENVRAHLGMTFHRFLDGTATKRRAPLRIFVNGLSQAHAVTAWNPFRIHDAPAAKETPVETLKLGSHNIQVRGFVMPHKDRLTEAQFVEGGGPQGWVVQQGFYVYRNDRIIVPGDWLRLSRVRQLAKEEQYKLARLSVDIPNVMDSEWSLDIKKSIAQPPAAIRDRLTDLAEAVRTDARGVFSHRGEYGPRPDSSSLVLERPWIATRRSGRIVYTINRNHPVTAEALRRIGPLKREVESMLRLVEETVPIQRIWLDSAESEEEHGAPYEGCNESLILEDIRMACDFLARTVASTNSLRAHLLATDPFKRYPALVERVVQERQ